MGFGPEGCCALAARRRCRSEVTVGRSRTDAKGPAHSWVSKVKRVFCLSIYDNRESRINITELLTPQESCQTFACFSFLNGRVCCFSLSLVIVNDESLGFRLLFGQKWFEDLTLGSGICDVLTFYRFHYWSVLNNNNKNNNKVSVSGFPWLNWWMVIKTIPHSSLLQRNHSNCFTLASLFQPPSAQGCAAALQGGSDESLPFEGRRGGSLPVPLRQSQQLHALQHFGAPRPVWELAQQGSVQRFPHNTPNTHSVIT